MVNYIISQNTGDKAWDEWLKKSEQLGANEFTELYNKKHKELGLSASDKITPKIPRRESATGDFFSSVYLTGVTSFRDSLFQF